MTKRDEAVFAKAFEAMEADGSLEKLRSKVKTAVRGKAKPNAKAVPIVSNAVKKQRQKPPASVSGHGSAKNVPLVASKK
jgi:hypothetical protein